MKILSLVKVRECYKLQRLLPLTPQGNIVPQLRPITTQGALFVLQLQQRLQQELTLIANTVHLPKPTTIRGASCVLQQLLHHPPLLLVRTLIENIALQLGHIITRGALCALPPRSLRHHLLPL